MFWFYLDTPRSAKTSKVTTKYPSVISTSDKVGNVTSKHSNTPRSQVTCNKNHLLAPSGCKNMPPVAGHLMWSSEISQRLDASRSLLDSVEHPWNTLIFLLILNIQVNFTILYYYFSFMRSKRADRIRKIITHFQSKLLEWVILFHVVLVLLSNIVINCFPTWIGMMNGFLIAGLREYQKLVKRVLISLYSLCFQTEVYTMLTLIQMCVNFYFPITHLI